MRQKSLSIAICIIFCFYFNTSMGQDTEPEGQLWLCWEATVNPALNTQFIDLQVDLHGLFKENNFPYTISTWTDRNFHYYFFYPVKTYDDKNDIWGAFGPISQQFGEEKWNKMWETITDHKTYFLKSHPEMSYTPEVRRMANDESTFAIWDMFYMVPGKEDDVYALGKEVPVLLRNINYDDNFQMLTGDVGYEGSLYIVVLYGKHPADFWTQNKKMSELMGEEGQKIFQQWVSLTKKREYRQFWKVERLTYVAE